MALVLTLGFLALLFLGAPILAAMTVGTWVSLALYDRPTYLLAQTAFHGLSSFTLLAIPLFVLAGEIMDKGGISARLAKFVVMCVGWLPGGLGISVVISTMIFSGISGSVNADAAAIGSVMLPMMNEAGYRKEWASCIVAASAGTGILIPPSITMIVLGTIANLSIKQLFLASLLPAALIGLSKAIVIWYKARMGWEPGHERLAFSWRELAWATVEAIPALIAPGIILGGILSGIFTATEAAAVAVLYAMLISLVLYRELTWEKMKHLLVSTVRLTGVVIGLVGAASAIAYVMAYTQASNDLAALASGIINNYLLFITLLTLLFWVLGAMLDGMPALVILIPLFMPIAEKAGMHPIHFAIFTLAVIGISLVTPPLGTACFVVTSLAGVQMKRLIWPMMPFLGIMFGTILILSYVPWFSLALPKLWGGLLILPK
jgi:tripartite ATP-independent transporter DctM subunit